MTVTELIETLVSLQQEIGCDGEKIGSHNLQSTVHFYIEDKNTDLDIELDRIELGVLPGCFCPRGITFVLKIQT